MKEKGHQVVQIIWEDPTVMTINSLNDEAINKSTRMCGFGILRETQKRYYLYTIFPLAEEGIDVNAKMVKAIVPKSKTIDIKPIAILKEKVVCIMGLE